MKKNTFLLLAFIGFSSIQLNAQTELTVTDAVEVETFTLGNAGADDLTASDAEIFEGTGSLADQTGYLRIISNGTFTTHKSRITFDLKSTSADVTSTLTFKFRKRIGNTVSGFVTVDGTTTNVTLNGTNGASFTEASTAVDNGFEDVEVELDAITLTSTAQTIVFTFTLVDQDMGTNNPQIRFQQIAVDKTAVACGAPTDVTTLAASVGAEHIALSWVAPTCFDEVLVVAKEGSAVTVTPTGDGAAYTANATFGSGTDLGTNEFTVFKGTTNSVVVNGLTKNGTTYHFEVFTRKGTTWSAGAFVNATTNNTYTSISGGNNDGLNWEDASSWIGGAVPSATSDDVIINAGIIINSDVELNNIVIESRLTITPGFSITANDIEQNSQFILQSSSSAFASAIVNTFSGTNDLIYDRWLNDSPNNDLISSPVGGVAFSAVATNSQNENRFFINSSGTGNYFFGPFNNSTGLYETYTTPADDAIVLTTAKGYRAATIAGNANTVRFTGTVLVAATDIDITDGGAGSLNEWNLIGNPYPSYLNFGTFFTANSGEFHLDNVAVYGWNGTGYTVWNGANSSGKLAPGQGFFVRTKDGVTGNVDFTTAMRTTGNTNDFVAKSANTNKALAKINLSNTTKAYSTNIYFIENQTRGLDFGYDAGAFSGTADGIYTNLVENNTGLALAIQSLSYNDFNDVVVPVAINSEAGVELTISLDAASLTIPSDTYVYLKDNLLNTKTLLNDVDYVFTPDTKLSGAGRFFIEFSSKEAALATDDYTVNEMLIYSNQKSIIIKGILKTDVSARVFDIQGRMVLEQKLNSSNTTNVISANALNTGIYMIQLAGKIQKVIIK